MGMCVCAISCEMAWFFLVEVVFCIRMLRYVRFHGLEGRGFMTGRSLKGRQRSH
jgi:hypothetical protein